MQAIQYAKQGKNYIIQGPPGTGKSQTIVNLIANKVAVGKSILFISEKRAALDVVYARISQLGLKEMCILIHDSQADKRSFILDLKNTYEQYSKEENKIEDLIQQRTVLIEQLNKSIAALDTFHRFQKEDIKGVNRRKLLDILIATDLDLEKVNLPLTKSGSMQKRQ